MTTPARQLSGAPVGSRLIAFLLTGIVAAAAHGQTLRDSVETALRRSPVVQRTIHEARMAAADVGVARAARRPLLTMDASAGPAYRERTVEGLQSGTGEWQFSRRAGFSLQQLLWDFGSTGRLVESARLRTLYSELLIAEALEDQAALVVSTYLDIIRYRLQARVTEEKAANLNSYRDRALGRIVKEGDVDLVILEGRAASSRADYALLTSRASAAEERFKQLTTLSPTQLSMPALPPIEDGSKAEAHPKVRAARAAVEAGKENVEALKRDRYPKLLFQAQGGTGRNVSGVEGPDKDLSALAVVRWDVFEGGRKNSLVQKARAEVDKNQAVVDEVRQAIDDDVSRAVEDLRGARKRYSAIAASIEDLGAGLSKTETLLDNAEKSVRLMSVVGAHAELSNSRRDLVDANMDRYKAAFAALAASGRLLDYLGVYLEPKEHRASK